MYKETGVNKPTEHVTSRGRSVIEKDLRYRKWNMKHVSKRDTSSLKDLRKDLKHLLIHQLQKQVFNASRQARRNDFQVPNTLTNTQNFMNRFLNGKEMFNTGPMGMRGHNIATSIGNFNGVQSAGLGKSNSDYVPVRSSNLDNSFRNTQHDNTVHQGPYISPLSNDYTHNNSSIHRETDKPTVKTDTALSSSWYLSTVTTESPTTVDHWTTIKRHYNVVHSTKRKPQPDPTYVEPFTPPTIPRQTSNIEPIAAAATVLHQNRQEHFHEPSTEVLPRLSSTTDATHVKSKHGSPRKSTTTTVSPTIRQESPTPTIRVSSNYQTPTPVTKTHMNAGSTDATKIVNGLQYIRRLTSPKNIVLKTLKVREPTMNPINETNNTTAESDSTTRHLNKLINLQGIHILFSKEKQDHTATTKHPTLHLSASIKAPTNHKSKVSSPGDRTAHVKSSNGDVHFSTVSENKYVGTAMMRNGHLFLVIYPPDKTYRHSTDLDKNASKVNKPSTNEHVHDIHDNITKNSDISSTPPTSKLDSRVAGSTFKPDKNYHSSFSPPIKNSISSSLKSRATDTSNLAYQRTATVKLEIPPGETLSKNHGGTDAMSKEGIQPTISTAMQQRKMKHHNMHHTHGDQSGHAAHISREQTHKHDMKEHINSVPTKENKKDHTPIKDKANTLRTDGKLHSDHSSHQEHKPGTMVPAFPPKATDPFMNIHGTHPDSHKMHGETASHSKTTTKTHKSHGSAERYGSPWKNVDLSSVLPSSPRGTKHKVDNSDDDSSPDLNVYSFVAKATDPFDKVQRILNNLQSSNKSTNDSNTNDETSFNFELTLNSDSTSAENAASSDDEQKEAGSQNSTTDNLLELLSSTIHQAAKAYDKDVTRDRILQKISEFAKSGSANSTRGEKLLNHMLHDFGNNGNKTQTLNELYLTNVITKPSTTTNSKTMPILPTMALRTTTHDRTLLLNPVTTKHSDLLFPASVEIAPTKETIHVMPERNKNSKNTVDIPHAHDVFESKHNGILETASNISSNRVPPLPTEIMKMIRQSNKSENGRKDYIRNQIVNDIVHTYTTSPPTNSPNVADMGQFHNHIHHGTRPLLQEFRETRQSVSGRAQPTRENELFLKSQTSKTEIHHEMPISKALYLIKQQTNDLRAKKASAKPVTKTTDNPQSNSEFNAMLILSIDDILADHTNLHGALVVSFLTDNTNGQSTT